MQSKYYLKTKQSFLQRFEKTLFHKGFDLAGRDS